MFMIPLKTMLRILKYIRQIEFDMTENISQFLLETPALVVHHKLITLFQKIFTCLGYMLFFPQIQ